MNRLRWIIRNHLCELADSDHLTQVVRKITGVSNYKYPKKSQNLSDLIAKSDYFIN